MCWMPSPSLQPVSRALARWRRPLVWGFAGLLVLELLYNTLLVTGLLATLLNPSLGRMRVDWSRAWSLVPGDVHVRDLKLRQEEDNGGHWELELEEVEVDLSLVSLLRRQLKAESLDVRGLHVRVHPATKDGEEKPRGPPPSDPWAVLLYEVRVREVRELTWKETRLTGITEASGNLELVPAHRISARDVRVGLGQGQLSVEGETVAQVEQGTAGFTLVAQRQEPEGGLDLIAGLSEGRLQLTATVPSFAELQRFTPRPRGLPVRAGAGRMEVDIHVKDGRLTRGTQLKGSGEPIRVPLGSLSLKAPWRLHSDVYAHEDGSERLGLKLTLGPVRLEGGGGAALETPELHILLSAKAPRLGEPLPDVRLELRAPPDNPLELRLLNAWLGPSFQVDSGRATLELSSRANPGNGQGSAHLALDTGPLQARWGGATFGGRVGLKVDAVKRTLHPGMVSLHGSHLLLRDVTVRTREDAALGWNGDLSFPEATLTLSPLAFEGRFEGSFSNAAPFVALLAHNGALPQWLSPLLRANGLKLSGEVSLGEEGARVGKLHAQGEGLELRGRAESTDGAPHAVLLVKVGIIPVGVEAGAAGTHIQVLRPSNWYEKKTGERLE